jgi:ribosomal-protein-alanine N-acetyltransferase
VTESTPLPCGALLRQLDVNDADALLDAYLRNRSHLSPYEPVRPDSFWTLDGQRARLESMVQQQAEGAQLPCTMVRDGRILGCATLNTIVRGPFRSASLGYWVDVDEVGHGLASATVAMMCRIGGEELDLHRIEASVLPSNLASQRVLLKNGFEQIGFARDYLHIDGRWQDCRIFQRILNDREPGTRPVHSR